MTTQTPTDRLNFVGTEAVSLGAFDLKPQEMMLYLYLPIKLIDSHILEIEPRLEVFKPLIMESIRDFRDNQSFGLNAPYFETYIYITAKRLFVTPDNIGNRPGYHCDGFGTDDINYLWTDKHSTVFNRGHFSVRRDDLLALDDMEAQARPEDEYTLPEKSLIRIDSLCPHRTPLITESGLRTFVKISFSKHRYNLANNSHNYRLSYEWQMHERSEIRNMENKDFHPQA